MLSGIEAQVRPLTRLVVILLTPVALQVGEARCRDAESTYFY